MTYIVTYDIDGTIITSSQGDATLAEVIAGSGDLAIQTDGLYNPAEYYVDLVNLVPVAKTAITSATTLSADVNVDAVLQQLPDCTVKYYEGTIPEGSVIPPNPVLATDTIQDGDLYVSSDLAGEYSIVLSAPTYLDTTVVLTVQD